MFFVSSAKSLTKDDIERFSRQIMVEGIGAEGMERIRHGRVLCVGAGGLGSTVALYLTAAGVGKLGLVDFDEVDMSNLHRQIIHTTDRVGVKKVQSARESCLAIFPKANIEAIDDMITPANAERLMTSYDVVVDASDNVASRYTVNDAAMRVGLPLVSGSAMRWDGQLSVYGLGTDGPCYRCLFPQPPPPAAVGSCNDSGVMGPVPGMIGCLQALEALKILAGAGEPLAGRMFIFDGLRFTARVVQLRRRQPACTACSHRGVRHDPQTCQKEGLSSPSSSHPSVVAAVRPPPIAETVAVRPEYIRSTCLLGKAYSHTLLASEQCCSATEMATHITDAALTKQENKQSIMVLDVRAAIQFDMAHLPGSYSLPLTALQEWSREGTLSEHWKAFFQSHPPHNSMVKGEDTTVLGQPVRVYVVCRRGVASAQAVQLLLPVMCSCSPNVELFNVDGGLNAYHKEVDCSFPYY